MAVKIPALKKMKEEKKAEPFLSSAFDILRKWFGDKVSNFA